MILKRSEMPISSFDPRYGELILRGAVERVEVKQTSRKDARRLANLLITFRARMKREYLGKDASKWEPYYGAIIGVSEDGFSTVIRPRDQEAEHLLQNISIGGNTVAGIEGKPIEAGLPAFDHDPLAEFDEGVPLHTLEDGEQP